MSPINRLGNTFATWLCGLVLLACMAPAWAATTTPSPRLDYCWTKGGFQTNSDPEIYGDRNLVGNCFSTVNDFYDVMVSTIQVNYNAAWPAGKPGRCDFGSCYGATFVTTSTFSKQAYGTLAGYGQYNNCLEPSSPAAVNNVAYCGLKRTDTTTWSCNTGSCMGWDNVVQVSDGHVADIPTYVRFSCTDSRLVKTGPNTTDGGCANIIDIYSGLQDCPACVGRLSGNGSIYPMTGAKLEVVPTELSIGGQSLYLTYDTVRQMTAKADGLLSAAQLKDLPSFGPLWSSSFHKRLNVKAGSAGMEAYRGSGRITSFGLNAPSGSYTATAGINDTLTVITGGYRFFDSASGVLETYNSAGQITSSADKKGNTLTYTYSTAAGAAAPAAGYLTQVTDNTGRSIAFTYVLPVGGVATSDGLISTVTAPDGRTMSASYDGNKNLTALTWPDGKSRTFQYENAALPWALTGKTDENNVRLATWAYDTAGRAISSDSVLGTDHYSATYTTPPQAVVTEALVGNTYYRTHSWQAPSGLQVTDATGTTSATNVVMPNGYPILSGITQAAGSGSPAASNASTYDTRGNLLSHDNFQGERTCYAYDEKNQEAARVEGLPNTADCAAVLAAAASLPPGARKYTTTWDANWRVPKLTTQPGSMTTLVYQGQPDPKNANAAANCSPAATLPNGAPLNLLCKSVVEVAAGASFNDPSVGSTDGLIDKVVLLLHGEDGAGSPVIADSSSYMKSISSRSGSPVTTAGHSKFGASSISLDGSTNRGAYGYGPDNTLKITGDFTIEVFVKLNAQADAERIIFGWGGDPAYANGRVAVDATGKLNAWWRESDFTKAREITGPVISTGVWHHIALSRSNGNWIMHLDGVQAGATINHNNSDAFSFGRFELGRRSYLSAGNLNGYLDELRITNGVTRYWGTFTPPTQQFGDPVNLNPSQPKLADAHYVKNILLLHADGAHGSKAIVDSSPQAAMGTLSGNAQISTTEGKFGGSSFYIPGSTNYTEFGRVNGDFSLPGDFTVEFWMKPASTTAAAIAVRLGGNGSLYQDFFFVNNRFVLQSSTGPYCIFGESMTGLANTWIHVAFVRVAGTVFNYVNGQVGVNCGWSTTVGSVDGFVDFGFNATSNAVYYDDIRVTRGQARYTANFIPSAYAAPNVAALSADASTVTTQYTYDAAGRVLTAKDTLNRTTTYAWYTAASFSGTAPNEIGHAIGDLQTVTNPAGHVTQFTQYDRAGRVKQMVDPKGVVTDTVYTPRGWTSSVTVTPPGGTARTTSYTYDNAGQLTGAALPDGTTLGYSYDAAHRLTGVTDAKGNSITYTLDNAGNKTGEQVKDPSGNLQRNITRVYDALNRVQQVTGASN
ncbi:LamG-like jellyroll fold domain-containing protein [Polaromonas sp. YR568]|uniref:LamG-like jellyroll fold domain-containing protein n=1 Tax=Polaromonas sp. YR568 TaxID=1855301 RepID=UPI00398BCDED